MREVFTLGRYEREALQRERHELLKKRWLLTPAQGARLDELEALLGPGPLSDPPETLGKP